MKVLLQVKRYDEIQSNKGGKMNCKKYRRNSTQTLMTFKYIDDVNLCYKVCCFYCSQFYSSRDGNLHGSASRVAFNSFVILIQLDYIASQQHFQHQLNINYYVCKLFHLKHRSGDKDSQEVTLPRNNFKNRESIQPSLFDGKFRRKYFSNIVFCNHFPFYQEKQLKISF